MGKDERHYNINKLNVIFAISSVLLLLTILGMFFADYDRPWKKYQTQFRRMEVEKARVKLDKETISLSEQDEYKELVAKLEEAKKEYETTCASQEKLLKDIKKLNADNALVEQEYKFRKAEMDAAKYRFEQSEASHDTKAAQYKQEFDELVNRVGELNLAVEKSKTKLSGKQSLMDQCGQMVKDLEREQRTTAGKRDILQRKLGKIDPGQMNFTNQIANMVRDLPIIDLANPNNKIEQVVLNDIQDSVNFMNVPKVERCISCHLGISNPDYQNEGQPYRTHPNLDLYVGRDSAHPLEEYGCTVCHGGRARGTSFNGAVHVPSSPQQKAEWEEKYNYRQMELWEDPMLPLQYTQAGCFKCHSGQTRIPGADKLNLGLSLIEKSGCYSCHKIEKYKNWGKPGPDLTKLKDKIDEEWIFRWLDNPHAFRHNTFMPAFFNQSNNSDPVAKNRTNQEISAIIYYLLENSQKHVQSRIPVKGNAKKGEELVKSVGCYACHQIDPTPEPLKVNIDNLRRRQGPNLIGLGSKTSEKWLYNWLKNPTGYHPETVMPNLRLTDQEAADIARFLSKDKNGKFMARPKPEFDIQVLNDILLGFLRKSETDQMARDKLAKMTVESKKYFAGKKLIGHYGCYSCHKIKGFEDAKPIGTELTEEGSKSIHNLDFGFIHIEHSKHAWFTQKLKNPRIFDKGKVKAADEKLRMPNFNYKDDEIEAIVTALLGFVGDQTVRNKKKPLTPENVAREQGEEVVIQFNCRGCHIVDEEGGTISDTIETWLKEYEGKTDNEASKVKDSFSPPNLHGIGKKLNSKWLFEFLHEPAQQIRPWIRTRMPTFNFNVSHLNSLVRYFQVLDGDKFPLKLDPNTDLTKKEYEAAKKLFSEDYFGCTQCHVVGNKLPTGSQDSWAPNLAFAKTRLQPEWLIEWIKNPSRVMPGTKMPTFFDPENYNESGPDDILDGDENEQIRVLRGFLFTLSETNPKKAMPEKAKPTPRPPVVKTSPLE